MKQFIIHAHSVDRKWEILVEAKSKEEALQSRLVKDRDDLNFTVKEVEVEKR